MTCKLKNNSEKEMLRFFDTNADKLNKKIYIMYIPIHHAVQALNSEWIIMRLLLYFCGS